jgi:predicted TIM-barrel fold metal-dependent hydrolase
MDREIARERLLEFLSQQDVVDAHEHFAPEEAHRNIDFTFFHWMMPYIQYDLVSVGMPKEFLWKAPATPEEVDARWRAVAPLWPLVKHGSYARPMRMALQEFYGYDDLTEANYRELGERMKATRYPGRYKEVLEDRCRIRYMLNQVGQTHFPGKWMKGAYQAVIKIQGPDLRAFLSAHPDAAMEDYLASVKEEIRAAAAEGAVLVKYDASSFLRKPDREKAAAQFAAVKAGMAEMGYGDDLACWFFDGSLEAVRDAGIVAAVHTGVWGDINYKSPLLLFPVVERHPDVTFDVYHMGMPFVRECGFLGKNYPNAYLNLCWSHIVSDRMAVSALDEWLDYVPVSKVFGFGADFSTMPENIWAHLRIARENLAEVFSGRIARGRMDLDDARHVLALWMYDNPARVYGLDR